MTIASTLTAGDTLDFTTSTPDYPASAGWGVVYKLIPRTAGTVITITSTASGADHLSQVGSSTTATWAAGTYSWVCYAVKAAERYTLQTGSITVDADPGVVTALDTRSSDRKALDAVNLALESYGSKAYMQAYYKANPDKFKKRSPEKQAKYNETRRQQYAKDAAMREAARAQSEVV